jgi:hypothetical protein
MHNGIFVAWVMILLHLAEYLSLLFRNAGLVRSILPCRNAYCIMVHFIYKFDNLLARFPQSKLYCLYGYLTANISWQ